LLSPQKSCFEAPPQKKAVSRLLLKKLFQDSPVKKRCFEAPPQTSCFEALPEKKLFRGSPPKKSSFKALWEGFSPTPAPAGSGPTGDSARQTGRRALGFIHGRARGGSVGGGAAGVCRGYPSGSGCAAPTSKHWTLSMLFAA